MGILRKAEVLDAKGFPRRFGHAVLVVALVLSLAACGEEGSSGGTEATGRSETAVSGGAAATVEPTTAEQALTPAEATVGPGEDSSMMPAGGREPDPAQPPPEDPPEGVKTYPATTNRNVERPVDYPREPPTNGDHAPIWQNCGFYDEPVRNENAVHSLDHGAVWITYRPDLPPEQIEELRPYGEERYVLISAYPDQPAPVIVTAWRNQLYLEDAGDPRLRRFVDQFRVTETAPLSGNGCVGGVGNPGA